MGRLSVQFGRLAFRWLRQASVLSLGRSKGQDAKIFSGNVGIYMSETYTDAMFDSMARGCWPVARIRFWEEFGTPAPQTEARRFFNGQPRPRTPHRNPSRTLHSHLINPKPPSLLEPCLDSVFTLNPKPQGTTTRTDSIGLRLSQQQRLRPQVIVFRVC